MKSKLKLRQAGLRPTKQRMIIADILFNGTNRHFTAENLQNDIISSGKQMSLATVYNCLNKFKNVGLIKKIETMGETSIFDTNVTNHHHFMDEETGELIDFSSDNISLRSCPQTPHGYERNGLDIIIKIKKVDSSTLK